MVSFEFYLEWKSFIKQIIVTDVVPCMHRVLIEHFQHQHHL